MSYEPVVAEAQIIKAMVTGRAGYVVRSVTSDHFEDPYMRLAFDMGDCIYRESFDVTVDTLREEFRAQAWSDEHADRIVAAIMEVPDALNLEHTVSVVARIKLRKDFQKKLEETLILSSRPGDISPAILAITSFAAKHSNLSGHLMTDYDFDMAASIGKVDKPGLRLGFGPLDDVWEHYPGTMNIVMGKRGQGKTAIALNAVRNLRMQGISSGFLSFEMRVEDLMNRLISMDTGVNGNHIKSGRMSHLERETVDKHKRTPKPDHWGKIHWQPGHSLYLEMLHPIIREMVQEHGVQFIVIDYLQRVRTATQMSTVDRIEAVSNEITRISLACDVAIMALAQPRKLETPTSMPEADDVYGSSVPANDATSGLSILTNPDNKYLIDFTMWKNRYGDRYEGQLHYDLPTQRIIWQE